MPIKGYRKEKIMLRFDSYIDSVRDLLAKDLSRESFDYTYRGYSKSTTNLNGDFVLEFDVPGVKEEDLSIDIDQSKNINVLGVRKTEAGSKEFRYKYSFVGADAFDLSNAKAKLIDGVLTLTFYKKSEKPPEKQKILLTK